MSDTQQDLITAAQSGDRLETLIALRDLLAERLQNTTSSRDISSMARRLMQVVSEIDALEKVKKDQAESGFNLRDFRRNIGLTLETMQKNHKLNNINAEHDGA